MVVLEGTSTTWHPTGLNNEGQVIGQTTTNNNVVHAVLWQDGQLTDLGDLGSTPYGRLSYPNDINDLGQIVGSSRTPNLEIHAFLWSGGAMKDIGKPSVSTSAYATAINNLTQVVGNSTGPGGSRPWVWKDGVMTELPLLEGFYGAQPIAINDRGQIIGLAVTTAPDYVRHAVRWKNGTMEDLGMLPGSSYCEVAAENELDQIVGYCYPVGGFLWQEGTGMLGLPTLGGVGSSALDVNDVGQIAGFAALPGTGGVHAALWSTKRDQSIDFAPLADKTFGDPSFTVSATASSGLPVTFSASGNCTITGGEVSLTGAGSCTITAEQAGDANYKAATNVAQEFQIAKATPTISWSPSTPIIYGQAIGGAQLNATVRGVGGVALEGTYSYSPAAGAILGPGAQTLGVTFTPADQTNYTEGSYSVSIAVEYNTAVGHTPLEPINATGPMSVFKIGQTIPVKFQLFLADGVTPVATAVATIAVNKVSDGTPSAVNEDVVSAVANLGVNFRYDATAQQYIFNLSTQGWTVGIYRITVSLDDGTTFSVDVGAR